MGEDRGLFKLAGFFLVMGDASSSFLLWLPSIIVTSCNLFLDGNEACCQVQPIRYLKLVKVIIVVFCRLSQTYGMTDRKAYEGRTPKVQKSRQSHVRNRLFTPRPTFRPKICAKTNRTIRGLSIARSNLHNDSNQAFACSMPSLNVKGNFATTNETW